MSFLGTAMLVSLGLIFLILVTQFNSLSKPIIILTEIIFSMIGVFLGYAITGMTISTIMMGVGIVALAGIVVRNGILLVEFTDLLKEQGVNTWDAIIEAGKNTYDTGTTDRICHHAWIDSTWLSDSTSTSKNYSRQEIRISSSEATVLPSGDHSAGP
jgi:hypothetical protein